MRDQSSISQSVLILNIIIADSVHAILMEYSNKLCVRFAQKTCEIVAPTTCRFQNFFVNDVLRDR